MKSTPVKTLLYYFKYKVRRGNGTEHSRFASSSVVRVAKKGAAGWWRVLLSNKHRCNPRAGTKAHQLDDPFQTSAGAKLYSSCTLMLLLWLASELRWNTAAANCLKESQAPFFLAEYSVAFLKRPESPAKKSLRVTCLSRVHACDCAAYYCFWGCSSALVLPLLLFSCPSLAPSSSLQQENTRAGAPTFLLEPHHTLKSLGSPAARLRRAASRDVFERYTRTISTSYQYPEWRWLNRSKRS